MSQATPNQASAVLEQLGARLTPEARQKLDAVIQLHLDDQPYTLDARAADGAGLLPGVASVHGLEPRLTVVTSSADFLKLVAGELNPMMAAMTGKLKISGDMGFAMKLTTLFG
jgi:putative sterol carrier protein